MKSIVIGMLMFAALSSASGEDERDIDPIEIHATSIARRLESLGFSEIPKDSGLYENQAIELGKVLEFSKLREQDLLEVPSTTPLEWVRRTTIEGNHTVLEHKLRKFGETVTSNTLVKACVNLGFARTKALLVGMSESRALAALSLIKANKVAVSTNEMPLTVTALRFLLPDETGLEIGVLHSENASTFKPREALVGSLTLGETGKGFDKWPAQQRLRIARLSIIQFRINKR